MTSKLRLTKRLRTTNLFWRRFMCCFDFEWICFELFVALAFTLDLLWNNQSNRRFLFFLLCSPIANDYIRIHIFETYYCGRMDCTNSYGIPYFPVKKNHFTQPARGITRKQKPHENIWKTPSKLMARYGMHMIWLVRTLGSFKFNENICIFLLSYYFSTIFPFIKFMFAC